MGQIFWVRPARTSAAGNWQGSEFVTHHFAYWIWAMFCGGSFSILHSLLCYYLWLLPFSSLSSLSVTCDSPKGWNVARVTKSTDCARPPWICRETNKEIHSVGVNNGLMLWPSFFFLLTLLTILTHHLRRGRELDDFHVPASVLVRVASTVFHMEFMH